jgi:hypothetical protein
MSQQGPEDGLSAEERRIDDELRRQLVRIRAIIDDLLDQTMEDDGGEVAG